MMPKYSSAFCSLFFLGVLAVESRVIAAEPKVPPTRAQQDQAARDVVDQTGAVNAGTEGLGQSIANAQRALKNLDKGIDKVKDQAKDAKKKADDAAKAAEKARDAASNCKDEKDKKKIQDLINDAKKKQKDAQDAKDKADKTEKDLQQEAKGIGDKLDKYIDGLTKTGDKESAAAEKVGLNGQNSAAVAGLERAKQRLDKEIENQQENRDAFNKAKSDFNSKLSKAKEGLDPNESLDQANKFLQSAEYYLNNCPPKEVAVAPKEVAIAVNDQQGSNVCVQPGQDASQIGGQVIASGPSGTIINSPQTVDVVVRIAKEKGVTLCWVEINFCTIYTPLTAYRGHDHSTHSHSGKDLHNHTAPDPPWSWGVKPPETVIRWSR